MTASPENTQGNGRNSALDNTTDTGKTLSGNGNDTATPENTVISSDKVNTSSSEKQGDGGESSAGQSTIDSNRSDDVSAPAGEIIGHSLTAEQSAMIVSRMEANAETAVEIELTPENWIARFGEDGVVETPVGLVKMGENQFIKMFSRKREGYFGMMYPTLHTPDIIIEKEAPAENAERDTKYLFIKTFLKPNGSRVVHFEFVTVRRDGLEVSVSSHEAQAKDIRKDMQKEKGSAYL